MCKKKKCNFCLCLLSCLKSERSRGGSGRGRSFLFSRAIWLRSRGVSKKSRSFFFSRGISVRSRGGRWPRGGRGGRAPPPAWGTGRPGRGRGRGRDVPAGGLRGVREADVGGLRPAHRAGARGGGPRGPLLVQGGAGRVRREVREGARDDGHGARPEPGVSRRRGRAALPRRGPTGGMTPPRAAGPLRGRRGAGQRRWRRAAAGGSALAPAARTVCE